MRKILIAAVLLGGVAAAPAFAQSGGLDLRVGKLEKEMKAVQRKVFPQGAPVEPELLSGPPPATAAGNPASAPIADLTARVDAFEAQLKSLTGQVEQDGFRLRKLEDALAATDARIKALEGTGEAVVSPAVVPSTALAPPATVKPAAITPGKTDPARRTAISAVEMPSTGDAEEDAYTYGFRLWSAKLYPEAQVKLKEFVGKHPGHRRASFAQNLLGRAYLDEGKPALASVAFYENYQKMPKGERASESLYWLGVALTRLKKPADACKAYDELEDVYAAKLTEDLRARLAKGRADAKCSV